tara:strand:+ start:13588 stop:20043 length:6456 start_codon:yes stop_codon:yes gene_type:complete
MAITAAMRQDIMELAVLMNNKAPGTTLLGELVVAANSGQTLEQIAATLAARAEFKATYPLFQTAKEFGEEWIGNILPEADAALKAECVAIVEAHINGGGSIPALVVSVQKFMSDSANATGALKVHVDNFTNKVAVATYHTITSEAADEWAIPATVTSSADSVATGNSTVDTALTAAVTAADPTYAVSGAATASEGDSVNYTISTTNVASGSKLTYTLGGVKPADIDGGSLTGQATIGVDGKAVVAVGIAADATTEGEETMTFTAGGASASTTITDSSLTPPPVGKAFSLTTGPDTFTGNAGDDSFNAAIASSWSAADAIDGVSGNDSFNITAGGPVAAPVGVSVKNIDTSTVTTTGTVTLNTTTWTGLTQLTTSSTGATSLTGSADTNITATNTAQAGAAISVLGGKDVSVTANGKTLVGSTVAVGSAAAAPKGTVTVTTASTAANGVTLGATTVTGGTEVTVTNSTNPTVNITDTAGAVTVTGTADTTTVTVTDSKATTAGATVTGHVNGAVTVNDVNRASTTKAGTITDVTVNSGAAVTVNSGALQNLTLSGTITNVDADTLGALTTAAINSLNLNVSDAVTTGAVEIDGDVKTLNLAANKKLTAAGAATTNTIADLDASGATAVNISGDAKITLSALTAAQALAVYTSTNSVGTVITPALGVGQTFTGGSGADEVTVGASLTATTMGAGDDTLNTGAAFGGTGTADGGDGTDTLALTAANAATATADGSYETAVSNFERLKLGALAGNVTVNVANADDIGYVSYAGAAAGNRTLTLNNLPANPTAIATAANAGGGGVTVNLADISGTADVANLKVSANGDTNGGVFTANGIETINFESDDTVTLLNPNTHSATITSNAVTTLNVTGDAGLTLTNTSTTITNFSAANMTGASDGDGVIWATIGTLAKAATITGSPKNDNLGNTGNTAAKALTMDGGAGQDTLSGGAGADTITDTSAQANGNGNNIKGLAGNDTITTGDGKDTIDGGGNNDSITSGGGADAITTGTGNDVVVAGAGNDTIVSSGGNDNISGGDGNDTFTMAAAYSTSDTIDGGAGTDSMTVTNTAAVTAGTTTGVESITLTVDTDTDTFAAAAITGLSTINTASGANTSRVDVTGLVSGVTIKNSDVDVDNLIIDTAAGASLTYDVGSTLQTGSTTTDAASVTITNTHATAGDVAATALDNVDTTRLDIDAGTGANLTVGTVSNTDKVATIDLSTSTAGRNLVVGGVADADSLTSLILNGDGGNITATNAIGNTGTAENLATITVNASNASTSAIGAVTMDTTDGTATDATAADLAATVTGTATFGSTATLGSLTNTFGTIALNTSGAGTVQSTLISADDVTGTIGAGGTHTAITAADDVTLTTTNSTTASTISTLTIGATVASSANVTHTGAGRLNISAINATAGTLTVDASSGGIANVVASAMSGAATLTGGTSNDTLTGGTGADSITGGDGNDTLTPTSGKDTVIGGAGDDTFVMGTGWSTDDTISDSAGTDTLTATVAGSITPAALSGVEKLTLTLNGGAVNAANISDVTTVTLNGAGTTGGSGVVTNLPATATVVNQNMDLNTVLIGYAVGSTNDLTLDFDGATEAVTNNTTTINNQGGALTLDGDAGFAVNTGNLTANSATSLTVSAEAGASGKALTLGNVSATAATAFTLSYGGTGTINQTVGTLAANSAQTLTISQAGTVGSTLDVGATTASNALTSVVLNNTGTGNSTIAAIDASAGTPLTSTSFDINWTGANATAANTLGNITVQNTGTITDFDVNRGAGTQADTIGNLVAKDLTKMTIVTKNGGGSLTFNDMSGVVGAIGDVTLDIDDTVTFSTGATGATSIGNITVTGLDNGTDANFGTWGATGSTIGNITFKGSYNTGSDLTTGAALSVGTVDTSAVVAGTIAVVLSNSTTIGTTMTGGAGIDNFTGTGAADTISGAGGAETLTGNGGNDTILGGAAADTIVGGAGNDSINGGAGTDHITGGAGADAIVITDSAVELDRVIYNATTDAGTAGTLAAAQGDVITGFTTTEDDLVFLANFVTANMTGTAASAVNAVAHGGGIDLNGVGTGNDVVQYIAAGANTPTAADLLVIGDLQAAAGTISNEASGDERILVFAAQDGAVAVYYYLGADTGNDIDVGELQLLATSATTIAAADIVFT